MEREDLKDFLEKKTIEYNRPVFIESDPIGVVHEFTDPRDIEIIGFLIATIAWGQRKTIVNNGYRLAELMGGTPYQFVSESSLEDQKALQTFKHRTFNGTDLIYFIQRLRFIYKTSDTLESAFTNGNTMRERLGNFKKLFFSGEYPDRTLKHVSDPMKGSAAKRLNMYLRWMVRKDLCGVDFGIWNTIRPSELYCPLDVHSGNVARKLGLLKRQQNDWQAVEELTASLRLLDSSDPVKYDFALFGLGVFEQF